MKLHKELPVLVLIGCLSCFIVKGCDIQANESKNSFYSLISSNDTNKNIEVLRDEFDDPYLNFLFNKPSHKQPTLLRMNVNGSLNLLNQGIEFSSYEAKPTSDRENNLENITDDIEKEEQNPIGFDPQIMEKAIQIIVSDETLDKSNMEELYILGFDDQQINQLTEMINANNNKQKLENKTRLQQLSLCFVITSLIVFFLLHLKLKTKS